MQLDIWNLQARCVCMLLGSQLELHVQFASFHPLLTDAGWSAVPWDAMMAF